MKWNIEWVDLQNMERMVAECWRMGGNQLEKYVQKLTKQQELIFAGDLGLRFLELLRKSIDTGKAVEWSKLQKDIHLMQELIQDGQAQHDVYWKSQYQELTANPKAYFGTEFGRAFTEQLRVKLELGISEEQRMLQHDIAKIQMICSTCNWDDEKKAKKALQLLTQDEKYYFSSWLGDAFINVLQERYGKKEEEEETEVIVQPEVPAVKKTSFRGKIILTFAVCILTGAICLLLFLRLDGGRGREKIQKIFSEARSGTDRQSDQTAAANVSDTQKNQSESPYATDPPKEHPKKLYQPDTEYLNVQRANEESLGSNTDVPDALDTNTADTGLEEDSHTAAKDTAAKEQRSVTLPEILPQYAAFHQEYPDLFGWLKIPGTEIDHPVMQSDDEARGERYFYLHRDYTGKQAEAGSLFVEETSSLFPQDLNTVIYGHNMSNGHHFGILEQYKDADFYEQHPVLQYDTIYETGSYQIAAVLITRILYQDEEGFRYYRFSNYHSEQEFQECADFIKENQLYDTGVDLRYGDQLVMLSTCEYSRPNGRLVVVARKNG